MIKTISIMLLLTLVAAGFGALFTSKTFRVETVIPTKPEAVWAVLMDRARYPEWNPVFMGVSDDYREGQTVTNTVRFPDGKNVEMAAKIKTLKENRELRQTGGVPGVLTFDHRWLLEPIAEGTKVTQYEVDRGLYLWFWDSSWIEPAYARASEALKKRVLEKSK